MPRIPEEANKKAIKVGSGVDMLNEIRKNSSSMYQEQIGEIRTINTVNGEQNNVK